MRKTGKARDDEYEAIVSEFHRLQGLLDQNQPVDYQEFRKAKILYQLESARKRSRDKQREVQALRPKVPRDPTPRTEDNDPMNFNT